MNKVNIFINGKVFPEYVQDLKDGWVGKLNTKSKFYENEYNDETIEAEEARIYLDKGMYKAIYKYEYDENNLIMLAKEIEDEIKNNNNIIRRLQNQNYKLERKRQKLLEKNQFIFINIER